ncbi:DUF2235 domain-containing protein [Mucilaginibacter sp. BJC16-A38]|uniref:DUF2235 domain-containing protein n=1 Tax=Mucilaginibacter phenanthrenivorans TaxID=1234842 RepID=UPI0021586A22|nr:DUF2235 domain-containing protein [Mucilaginibacter phenanthrenivorans]MCR8561061.1 DUF2235 domain-containing protein [Mucilaginibacter phenanthrenivorans]
MFKRLITCTDGTWNKPAERDAEGHILYSNVCYLYDAIAPKDKNGIEQLKVYDTGVGSSYRIWDKVTGGLTGAGLDEKIKDCYTFLMLNYAPGDHIYLFGFSRGAYTARSLAGFIRCCGILRPDYIHLVDKAYDLYRNRNDYTEPESDLMRSFRQNYCFENVTRIKFVGVWDTVGALGIPLHLWQMYNKAKYKFHDTTLSSTIDYAYHALAIDEHRSNFAPELWAVSDNKKHGATIDLEQRWFSGVHSDIGGGYPETGLSNHALHWMAEKAEACGLHFETSKLKEHKSHIMDKAHKSFTFPYWFSGWLLRPINPLQKDCQTIDESVFTRIREIKNYRPKNIIPNIFKL